MKLFAPIQAKCWECGVKFVPYSKESIRLWDVDDVDWLAMPSSVNWAVDRTYQENLRFCSTACMYTKYAKDEIAGIKRSPRKHSGKHK